MEYGAHETLDRLGDDDFESWPGILMPAIYALVYKRNVVYIGQSKKPLGRIYTHRNMWGKRKHPWGVQSSAKGILFDDVWVRPCLVEELDQIEREMIEKYRPSHNIRMNKFTTVPPEMQNLIERIITSKGKTVAPKPSASPRIERRGF